MSRKLNGLKIAQEIADKKDGKCLSSEYTNIETKMLWKCKDGHEWKATLNNIKNCNQWCPYCSGNVKLSLETAQEVAKEKNGKCLSAEYINNGTDLLWECSFGHKWFAPLDRIKNAGRWCPYCSKKAKLNIEVARQMAIEKGGKCLSKEYTDNKTKMLWECLYGHKWKAPLSAIRNHWCPECGRLEGARKVNNSYTVIHWKTGQELVCQASWEKRVVEYFNVNRINFRWQPRSFSMPDGRKYYPDLYLYSTKKWVEIKGHFWDDAKEKWEWFQTIKPNSELWNKAKLKKMRIL